MRVNLFSQINLLPKQNLSEVALRSAVEESNSSEKNSKKEIKITGADFNKLKEALENNTGINNAGEIIDQSFKNVENIRVYLGKDFPGIISLEFEYTHQTLCPANKSILVGKLQDNGSIEFKDRFEPGTGSWTRFSEETEELIKQTVAKFLAS